MSCEALVKGGTTNVPIKKLSLEETSLGGEDLVLYFNCLKLYPEFPKYLTENNSKKI